jgi:hypothetical protein
VFEAARFTGLYEDRACLFLCFVMTGNGNRRSARRKAADGTPSSPARPARKQPRKRVSSPEQTPEPEPRPSPSMPRQRRDKAGPSSPHSLGGESRGEVDVGYTPAEKFKTLSANDKQVCSPPSLTPSFFASPQT